MRLRGILSAAAAALVAVTSGVVMSATAGAAGIGCGSVITTNTTLTADVGPCPNYGLVIGANNVTLNLGGHAVIGTFTQEFTRPPTNNVDAEGIHFRNVSGSTVTNGSVTHFAVGVRLDGGGGNTVEHLDVHDNIGKLGVDKANNGDGIAMRASDHNLITDNVVRHNGPWDNIATLSPDGSTGTAGSSYNTISHNIVDDSNIAMLNGDGKPSWKQGNGIAITGPGSTHNLVDHNVVDGNGVDGIQVFPACINSYNGAIMNLGCAGTVPNDYNVISNNVVRNNGFGAPVAIAPIGDGILILAMGPRGIVMPGHETVSNNVTTGNQRNGIAIGGGNGQDLFNAPGTTGGGNYGCSNINSGGGNTGVPTADLCGPNDNTVTNNTSSGNGDDGIELGPKSTSNTVTGNHVSDNKMDGIGAPLAVLFNANDQGVTDGHGGFETIPTTAAFGNTFSDNTASGDGEWDGLDGTPGCNNTWNDNTFGTVNESCVSA